MSTTPSSTVNTTLGNDSASTKTSAMPSRRAALLLQLFQDELELVGDVAQRSLRALAFVCALFRFVGYVEHAGGERRSVSHERRRDGFSRLGLRKNIGVADRQAGGHVNQRV